MRIEKWSGHKIRFVEIQGEWYAILKDICDALELRTAKVAERVDSSHIQRVPIEVFSGEARSRGDTRTRWMLVVDEEGIYEILYASRKIEAKRFRAWSATVMKRLRKLAGLQGYDVMRMMDDDVQEHIDSLLDTIYWDEEKKCLMRSVTVAGGDVDQVPFME